MKLIMESVPYEAGSRTDYSTLYYDVNSYCNELGCSLNKESFNYALKNLHNEQSIVFSSNDVIRPTQYGLNKYQ